MELRQQTWVVTDASGKEIARRSGGFSHPGDAHMAEIVEYLLKR